ncbi:MAG TPA: OB-fold domain-containing protein [Rhizomicrobium sp.]
MAPAFPFDPPIPTIDPDNRSYWEAADRGELTYSHCRDCDRPFFYPRSFCPFCFGDNVELLRASGKGEIYAVTIVRRADPVYALAYVRLAEGPTMFTNIVECDFDKVKIGQAVEVTFSPGDTGQLVPRFKPLG